MAIESINKVIGFATEYYTLWSVAENKQYVTNPNTGEHIHVGTNWVYNYIQNLSKDEEQAIKKIAERYNISEDSVIVDEGLRGVTTRSFEKYIKICMPYTVFPFGKLKWMEIRTSDDVWQLKQVLEGNRSIGGHEEFNTLIPRKRKVLARQRLLELGEIIRFNHIGKVWDDEGEGNWEEVPCKYMTKRDYENHLKAQASFHLHSEGDKVEVSLKCIHCTGYDSAYGFTSIITYENEKGEQYIYKGGTPPDIELGDDKFTKVKGTVKHGEYKGIKQTFLQRIKIV